MESVAEIKKSLGVVELAYLQFASDWYDVKQGETKSLEDQYNDANVTNLYDLKLESNLRHQHRR